MMDQDFGAFTVISSSPPGPGTRLLSHLTQHMHRPHAPSRSASTLSPVVEGNEDPDGRGGPEGSEPIRVISTSIAPSKTFLELTQGGMFNSEEDDSLGMSNDKFGTLSHLVNGGGFAADPAVTITMNNNEYPPSRSKGQKESSVSLSKVKQKTKTSTSLAVKDEEQRTTTARSPITRPKMKKPTLNGADSKPPPKPTTGALGPGSSTESSVKPLPSGKQSVEQAVHRDRVNSLLRPQSNKSTLGKINPPSNPTGDRPTSVKVGPPSEALKNGLSQSPRRTRKVASVQSRTNGKQPSPPAAAPGGPSGRIGTPGPSTKHPDTDNITQPRRRKSLPDIQGPSPSDKPISCPTSPSANDGAQSPPARRMQPRRKISEPCFPTYGSPFAASRSPNGIAADPRQSPDGASTAPAKKPPLRRKISEPCFPTSGSPVFATPPWGITLPDRLLSPTNFSSRTTSCPDLLRRQGAETRKQSLLRSLPDRSRNQNQRKPPTPPPNFMEEFEKNKACRYLRRAGDDNDGFDDF